MRFLHGFIGGMLVGIGFSDHRRERRRPIAPSATCCSYSSASAGSGLMLLPPLVPTLGHVRAVRAR